MMTSDDKVGGWVKKGQNHDDVILEWSLIRQKMVGTSHNVPICSGGPASILNMK